MQSRLITLPDGRALSYSERGDPSGWPVLYFHGALGYRWEWPLPDANIEGLRCFALERPGFGYSSDQPRRTLLDWAEEVRHFVDHLRLQQFSIAAWSTGCPHALACAYALQDRVRDLYLMCCPVPRLGLYGNGLRLLGPSWLAQRAPGFFRDAVRFLLASSRVFHAAIRVEIATEQMVLLRDPVFVQMLQRDHASALVQGPAAFVLDLALCNSRWGFPLRSIGTPVVLWNGEHDGMVKPATAQWLRGRLPNVRVILARGATHFLPFTHGTRVIDSIRCGRDRAADTLAG